MNGLELPTVLNVDDSEARRYAKSRILKRGGYQVIESETGAEALRGVSRSSNRVLYCSMSSCPIPAALQSAKQLRQTRQPRTLWFCKFRLCTLARRIALLAWSAALTRI